MVHLLEGLWDVDIVCKYTLSVFPVKQFSLTPLSAAEGGENMIALIFQWKHDPYDAPADDEQLVTDIPPAK
jgi:hypothetical protein